jgi:sulfate adenylyltransferase
MPLDGFITESDWRGVCEDMQLGDGMATAKTYPHNEKFRVNVSDTHQREILSNGGEIYTKYGRPEVIAVSREFYESQLL